MKLENMNIKNLEKTSKLLLNKFDLEMSKGVF